MTADAVIRRPSRYDHSRSASAAPIAPYVSVLLSTSRAIQYTVTMCNPSTPTARTNAPGIRSCHRTGWRGRYQLATIVIANGTSDMATTPTRPSTIDRSPRSPISAAKAKRTVVSPSTPSIASAGRLSLAGVTPQTSPYTIRRTFSSAAGAEEQRHHADDQRREPREPGEVGGAADGFGDEPPDAGLARQVAGVLVGGFGGQPEPDHRDEHVRHHEQEDPERHRAREHDTAGGDVAVDGAEAGVDQRGVGARPLEAVRACPRFAA